jgi:hypothetical protein
MVAINSYPKVQGVDPHNKGWFVDNAALIAAYPIGSDGDYAIVGSTDTVWVWDSTTVAWVDTASAGLVSSVFTRTGDIHAQSGDYAASLVSNDSVIPGSSVKDALNNCNTLLSIYQEIYVDPDWTAGDIAGFVYSTLDAAIAYVNAHPTTMYTIRLAPKTLTLTKTHRLEVSCRIIGAGPNQTKIIVNFAGAGPWSINVAGVKVGLCWAGTPVASVIQRIIVNRMEVSNLSIIMTGDNGSQEALTVKFSPDSAMDYTLQNLRVYRRKSNAGSIYQIWAVNFEGSNMAAPSLPSSPRVRLLDVLITGEEVSPILIRTTASSAVVTTVASGFDFNDYLSAGSRIKIESVVYVVQAVNSATQITLTATVPTTYTDVGCQFINFINNGINLYLFRSTSPSMIRSAVIADNLKIEWTYNKAMSLTGGDWSSFKKFTLRSCGCNNIVAGADSLVVLSYSPGVRFEGVYILRDYQLSIANGKWDIFDFSNSGTDACVPTIQGLRVEYNDIAISSYYNFMRLSGNGVKLVDISIHTYILANALLRVLSACQNIWLERVFTGSALVRVVENAGSPSKYLLHDMTVLNCSFSAGRFEHNGNNLIVKSSKFTGGFTTDQYYSQNCKIENNEIVSTASGYVAIWLGTGSLFRENKIDMQNADFISVVASSVAAILSNIIRLVGGWTAGQSKIILNDNSKFCNNTIDAGGFAVTGPTDLIYVLSLCSIVGNLINNINDNANIRAIDLSGDDNQVAHNIISGGVKTNLTGVRALGSRAMIAMNTLRCGLVKSVQDSGADTQDLFNIKE